MIEGCKVKRDMKTLFMLYIIQYIIIGRVSLIVLLLLVVCENLLQPG